MIVAPHPSLPGDSGPPTSPKEVSTALVFEPLSERGNSHHQRPFTSFNFTWIYTGIFLKLIFTAFKMLKYNLKIFFLSPLSGSSFMRVLLVFVLIPTLHFNALKEDRDCLDWTASRSLNISAQIHHLMFSHLICQTKSSNSSSDTSSSVSMTLCISASLLA